MPQRKTTSISVAGSNEPSDSEDDNTPLKKKAKTSSSQSATSREQRPRTVSKKQAALSNVLSTFSPNPLNDESQMMMLRLLSLRRSKTLRNSSQGLKK